MWPVAETYKKNQSWDLMPKFVAARDLEDARRKVHFFVDKMFNEFYMEADKSDGSYVPVAPSPSMDGLDSLTIGEEPTKEVKPKTTTDGLLNLSDLV